MAKESLAIIGAGVIGLTTGLEAQRRGYQNVTIYSALDPLETTSAKAGAVFEPYQPGNMSPTDMREFVRIGMGRYQEIVERYRQRDQAEIETGVRMHPFFSTSTGEINPETMPFLPEMGNWQLIHGPDVPGGYASAISFESVPMIDPTKALPYLAREFENAQGRIQRPYRKIIDLQQFMRDIPEDVVVNCSGLGARELVGDEEVRSMRGQIAVLNYRPNWDWSILGDDGYYVFPRRTETILGGTTESEEEEITTDEAIGRIIDHARRVIPDLSTEDIGRTYAGLRPYRVSGAKVDVDTRAGKIHVSNFGHGGSGWTFCWGSAERAMNLVTGDVRQPAAA